MAVSPILSIPEVAPTQVDKTTTMNDAIEAIEAATQDQLVVSMASGNVTLTTNQYTRHVAFDVTGLTADRDLVVPLTKRVFVVRNNSAHNCTVKGSSGATVVVAAGDASIIQNTGIDCISLAAGGAGVAGPTGLPGGGITIGYTFSTTTTNTDPGSGTLRLNNATQNTATAIYLDLLDGNAIDWTSVLDSLDDSTSTTKGALRLFDRSDDSKMLLFSLSAVISRTGYRELTVALITSSAASPFSNGDLVVVAFERTGDKGTTGSTGSTGATGASTAWHDGSGVPSGGLGSNGDYYLNDNNGDVYLKNTGNSPAWGLVANIATAALASTNTWTAAQRGAIVTLTDAATIATDMNLGNNYVVTLGGNRTLGNPSNVTAGQAGQITVVQDGTGSRTLVFASDWKFPGGTAPTLSTTAGAIDILSYYVIDATTIAITAILNLS